MNHHYIDIRDRIKESPKWWDEHAVPRYCDFSPDALANIYADECCLLVIKCQGCEFEFRVAMSLDPLDIHKKFPLGMAVAPLRLDIRAGHVHYGDPPNIGCCGAGPSMNSIPVRVEQYWRRSVENWQWVREPSLEIEIKER